MDLCLCWLISARILRFVTYLLIFTSLHWMRTQNFLVVPKGHTRAALFT